MEEFLNKLKEEVKSIPFKSWEIDDSFVERNGFVHLNYFDENICVRVAANVNSGLGYFRLAAGTAHVSLLPEQEEQDLDTIFLILEFWMQGVLAGAKLCSHILCS